MLKQYDFRKMLSTATSHVQLVYDTRNVKVVKPALLQSTTLLFSRVVPLRRFDLRCECNGPLLAIDIRSQAVALLLIAWTLCSLPSQKDECYTR